MTMSGGISEEQYETAKRVLESYHGRSIYWTRPDEASSLYLAIEILEAAEQGELVEGDHPMQNSDEKEMVELSRDKRNEGYAEATLLDEVASECEEPETLGMKLWRLLSELL